MVGFSVRATLRIYYPSVLENRLKKLRFKNRISPTGNSMVMLNEHEEDTYLDQEMQDGEKLRSVSYDVWKDEKTGFVKIEKYVGSFHSDLCPRCNYQTLNIVTEKLVKASSNTSNDLLKSYKCSFCGFKEDKIILLKSRGTSTVFSN
jgi:DNA-directed RNA polymerase subunit RPC12/RpoP